jgi:hypothetical protein
VIEPATARAAFGKSDNKSGTSENKSENKSEIPNPRSEI